MYRRQKEHFVKRVTKRLTSMIVREVLIVTGTAFMLLLACAFSAVGQSIATIQYHLTGLSLGISPSALTVPRRIPSQLNTSVSSGANLPSNAVVQATLRGPSFSSPLTLTTTPGQPLAIPPLPQPGTYYVENIALVLDANTTIPADPPDVTIDVLDQLLVASVTSQQLTLDQIKNLGIQIDTNNFTAFQFTIGLTTGSQVIPVTFPVAVPSSGGGPAQMLGGIGGGGEGGPLPGLPGLNLPNLSIQPVMLNMVVGGGGGNGQQNLPPIPGILIIPGNIAFLNQFFDVQLVLANEAPDGTPLVVTNLTAQIQLPPGPDGLEGDITKAPPFQPGQPEFDNPLRLATTAAGRQNIKPVIASVSNGTNALAPQQSGTADFLVEGVQPGPEVVEVDISGTLLGLPGGPAQVTGTAKGAVVVRDPTFSLTFMHPNVVQAGEAYNLTIQLQNTSLVDANLVTVSLDPRNMTGAQLLYGTNGTQVIDTIHPGQSATVVFQLEALDSGQVTASMLNLVGAGGLVTGAQLVLQTGVSQEGVPLSPDTILLPASVAYLSQRAQDSNLIFRASALLGEANSIATAPSSSLPASVLPMPSSTIVQRADELAEAGLRLEISDMGNPQPLPQGLLVTLEDLYFDFLGDGFRDDGWDALYNQSQQARLFGDSLAEVIRREWGTNASNLGSANDLIGLQQNWGNTEAYQGDQVTVMTSEPGGGTVPVTLDVTDNGGNEIGSASDYDDVTRQIPGGDMLNFNSTGPVEGQFTVLTKTNGGAPFTATLSALAGGTFDLGIVVPGSDGVLRQFVFRSLSVLEGDELTATIQPRTDPPVTLTQDGNIVEPSATNELPVLPPQVLGVVQNADPWINMPTGGATGCILPSPVRYGQMVEVLFDRDIAASGVYASIPTEDTNAFQINPASITMIPPPALNDSNVVVQALQQFGSRIVFIGLRDPVGPFVPRTINISGITDSNGVAMVPAQLPIMPDPLIGGTHGSGGQVSGHIYHAGGTPVPGAIVEYLQTEYDCFGLAYDVIVTTKYADSMGRYDLDYVFKNGTTPFHIVATDPASGESVTVYANIRYEGQRMQLDMVLVGRGIVQGTVRDTNGVPIGGANITITSGTDGSSYASATDQKGFYQVPGVPVGEVGVMATSSNRTSRANGTIPGDGGVASVDLTIFDFATQGAISGVVLRPDGTPATNTQVFVCEETSRGCAFLDSVATDASGTFSLTNLPIGNYTVRGLDQANGLVGSADVTLLATNGPNNPVYVQVLLQGVGTVTGTVYERQANGYVPVGGALVAGGLEIVATDTNGNYVLPNVPVGADTITAMDTNSNETGTQNVTIVTTGQQAPGIDIYLAALGGVSGHVYDPKGNPASGQEVTLVVSIGDFLGVPLYFTLNTNTDANGLYSFAQLDPNGGPSGNGTYPITATNATEVANGTARLLSLLLNDVVDLHLAAPQGEIAGKVVDQNGFGVAAAVSLQARVPNAVGMLQFNSAGSMTSDPNNGFSFSGLFYGPYVVSASSFFSPAQAQAAGTLSDIQPAQANIVLVLGTNSSSLSGCVFAPDGSPISIMTNADGTLVPLSVSISSSKLQSQLANNAQSSETNGIQVDASSGCYKSSIDLPPDHYTVQVTDNRIGSPTYGLTGQATVDLPLGSNIVQNIRLLGLGALSVQVMDASGASIPGVTVTTVRATYPNDTQQAMLTQPTSVAPLLFSNITEGPVSVSALVSSDPSVNVGGRDDLRGYGGNAMGMVVRGATNSIVVVLQAAGNVTGQFFRTDGTTPVPYAQVSLSSPGQPTYYDVTDSDGGFQFVGVPVGTFALNGFDPATGRRGSATGEIDVDGQQVTTDLLLGPLGTVSGIVLDASQTTPSEGANVTLSFNGGVGGQREVTTGVDGSFSFQSVPGGSFLVFATDVNGLNGQTSGELSTEGQSAQVTVVLEGSGTIQGTVLDAFGVPVPEAQVTLTNSAGNIASAEADINGNFVFYGIPVGPYELAGRPANALTPGDGGETRGILQMDGQTATNNISFQGTIGIGVAVNGTVGSGDVSVAVDSEGLFGGRAAPSGIVGGTNIFQGIPDAPLTVSAWQTTPAGEFISASQYFSQSSLPPPGGQLNVQLTLAASATITGLVVYPSGQPAFEARVTLTARNFMVDIFTDTNGAFQIVGVPLNANFTLLAQTLDGSGQAVTTGNTQPTQSVTMVLDVTPPSVVSVLPAANTVGVLTNATIFVQFSEAVDTNSLNACGSGEFDVFPTFSLLESSASPVLSNPSDPCSAANMVPLGVTTLSNGMAVVLTPLRPLLSLTRYTIVVSHGEVDALGDMVGGVRAPSGLQMAADYTSQFVTRDEIPSVVLDISPTNGQVNVALDSVVRVAFSKPVDPASITDTSVAVTGPNGPVAGQRNLILGNTVLVFTPANPDGSQAFFQPNATYTVAISGIRDVSGNIMPVQGNVNESFATLVTIPPVISAFFGPATANAGQSVVVSALTTNLDIAMIDFYLNGVLAAQASAASGTNTSDAPPTLAYNAMLLMPTNSIQVTALPVDVSGNIGASTNLTISLTNAPPFVAITNPLAGSTFPEGISIVISATATDAVAVARVVFSTNGTAFATNVAPPYAYALAIPGNYADSGTTALQLQAVAYDNAGIASTNAVLVSVSPDQPPTITLTQSPTNGSSVIEGTRLVFAASATDDIGVTRVDLVVNGSVNQTLSTAPFTFAYTVPPATNAVGGIQAALVAYDTKGLSASTPTINLQVIAHQPPGIAITGPTAGSLFIQGTPIPVTAVATDSVSIARVEFSAQGQVFGIATRPPYTATLTAPTNSADGAPAALQLVATAYDNIGLSASTSTVVTVVGPPDLSPLALTPTVSNIVFYPTSPQSPALQVVWTVANQGAGPANGYWFDRVYVSTNLTIEGAIASQDFAEYWGPAWGTTPLASGGTYQRTNNISLPQISGTYYLILSANDDQTLYEADYGNNQTVSGPIMLTYQLRPPDLAPVSLTPATNQLVFSPSSPQSPTVQVTWAVTNFGTGPASGQWYDEIYVSTNTTLAGQVGGAFVGWEYGPVAVNGSYSGSTAVTLPQQSGTYYLIYSADDDEGLYEPNYVNNVLVSDPIVLTYEVRPPDLAPISLVPATNNVVLYPTSPQSPSVQVNWAVTNLGTGAATGQWYDEIYVSTNTTVAGQVGGAFVGWEYGPLAVNGSYSGSTAVTLPQQSGTYFLIYSANDGENLYESDYTNNLLVAGPVTLTYQVEAPDLDAMSIVAAASNIVSYPGCPESPTVAATWTVSNTGIGPAVGYWADRVYVSTNETMEGAVSSQDFGEYWGSDWGTTPLAPGQFYESTNTIELPEQSGTYYLILNADADQYLYDANYANNVAVSGPITLAYQVQSPDLVPFIVTAPASITASQPYPGIQVVWGVTNQGVGAASGYWYDTVWFSTNGVLDDQSIDIGDFEIDLTVPPDGTYWQTNTVYLPFTVGGIYNYTLFVQAGQGLCTVITSNNVSYPFPGNLTLDLPPQIVAQPFTQLVTLGSNAIFIVSAVGTPPLTYQWWFNNTLLPGATNATLALTNVQFDDSGNYYAVVANPFGAANSSLARLLVSTPGTNCASPPPGMIGWWQAESNAQDIISGNFSTLEGNVGYGAGEVGQAFAFDGENDEFIESSTPSYTNVQNNFTIEFWAWPMAQRDSTTEQNSGIEGIGGQQYAIAPEYGVIDGSCGAGVSVGTNGISIFEHSAFYLPSLLVYDAPIVGWTHIALVYRDKQPSLYVNGVLVRSGLFSQKNFIFPSKLFGDIANYGPYDGLLDEVSIYDRALSDEEVASIYAAGSGGKCAIEFPPTIVTQPANLTAIPGDSATFTVSATGTAPLAFQWFLNGNALAGDTNATLPLVSVTTNDAGNYSVVITNVYGSVTSAVASLTVFSTNCVTPPPGIVAWWPMDGNVTDIVSGITPFAINGLSFVPGQVGEGVTLGSGGYIDITNAAALESQQFTWEAWVRWDGPGPDEDTEGSVILQKAVPSFEGFFDYGLYARASGQNFVFECGNSIIASSNSFTQGVFYHVAGSYDGTAFRLYVDGALEAEVDEVTNIFPAGQWAVGANAAPYRAGGYPRTWNGVIDEVSIYDRALSPEQILGIYLAGSNGKCTNELPPTILTEPANQLVSPGGNATFAISASGTGPLFYQWLLNGNVLAGNTNSSLSLLSVTTNDSGSYSVVVTNFYGSVTSAVAILTVTQLNITTSTGGTVVFVDNFECGLGQWQPGSGGVITNDPIYGPVLTFNRLSSGGDIWSDVTVPAGSYLSFDYKGFGGFIAIGGDWLAGQNGYGGIEQALTYDNTWRHYEVQVRTTGQITIEDYSGTSGQQSPAFFDNIVVAEYPNTVLAPAIISPPSNVTSPAGGTASFAVCASGDSPLSFQWQLNGTNLTDDTRISGSQSANLSIANVSPLDNGNYQVIVSNSYGSITSSPPATLVVLSSGLVQNGSFETGDFTDWTLSGDSDFTSVSSDTNYVHSGDFGAALGPESLGYLSQTIATIPGQSYWLSFWLKSDGASPNEFQAIWDGGTIYDQIDVPASDWTNIRLAVTATQTATSLQFGFLDAPSYLGLDDISLETNSCPVATISPAVLPAATYGVPYSQTLTATGGEGPFSFTPSPGALPPGFTLSTNGVLSGETQIAGTNVFTVTATDQNGCPSSQSITLVVLPPAGGYAVTIPAGLELLLGNPLNNGSNSANVLFPNPDPTQDYSGPHDCDTILTYTCGSGWQTVYFDSVTNDTTTGFIDDFGDPVAPPILAPGSAFLFLNGGCYGDETIIFTGTLPTIVLPPASYCGCGMLSFLSLQATNVGSFQDLTGLPAVEGTQLISMSADGSYTTNTFENGGWLAGTPVIIPTQGYGVLIPCSNTPPMITVQPEGQTVPAGASVAFNVTAVGAGPLRYQWKINGTNLMDCARICGCHSNLLTIADAQFSDAGNYAVVVSNPFGSVVSSNAPLPVIGYRPALTFLGFSQGRSKIQIQGQQGLTYVIEWSDDMRSWKPLLTNTLQSASLTFTNMSPPNVNRRFFRARLMQ